MASSSTEGNLATAKTVLTTAVSAMGAVMFAGSVAQSVIPHEFQEYFFISLRKFFKSFSSELTVVIDESSGYNYNELYDAAEIYLGTKISTTAAQRINVSKPHNESIIVKMERNEEVIDVFQGVKFKWYLVCTKVDTRNQQSGDNSNIKTEVKAFEVSFPKKHKDMVIETYFPYIVEQVRLMEEAKRTIQIFTVDNMYWTAVNLDHPATFDTLAMDSEVKETILKDLDTFVKRKDYYRKIGKAWKRGYLLYGPPGTGKSSLIAAMANYLKFDVYDLELTELNANSDLRKLLLATSNRSILVVEDIDCTIELENRLVGTKAKKKTSDPQEKKGLLNFIDGLWSSCGDERIIVFTTNHKEKLDPALLRPGRMDVHVHMSYCTPCGFRIFANNYLGIKDHELFGDIDELIKTTQVSPAEVAEQLMRGDGVENVLRGLIEFLKVKHKENVEPKTREIENGDEDDDEEEDSDEEDN